MDSKNLNGSHSGKIKSENEKMQMLINELQLLFAEKRTALSVLRTGIAVFALPLSVMSVLIATSKFYKIGEVMSLFIPLVIINTVLIALGIYLIFRSLFRLHKIDMHITRIKKKSPVTEKLVE